MRVQLEHTTSSEVNGVTNLRQLKKMAQDCIFPQFIAAIFFLLGSLIFPTSRMLAVADGIIAILIALIPLFYAIFNRRIFLIMSCICSFNLAPIWFLYLEAVLPGYDAYTYSSSGSRMEALFWISIFQICVNICYICLWKILSIYSIKSFSFLHAIKLKPLFYLRSSILAFVIPLVGFYLFYGSADILWIALTGGRGGGGATGGLLIQESVGGLSSLMLPLNWIWQLTPLLSTIAFISSPRKFQFLPIFSLMLGLLVIFGFFLSGSRGTMIFVAAPVLFFIFYYNSHRGARFWLLASTLFFLLVGVMELQVRFRGNLLEVISNPSKAAKEQGYSSATSFDPSKSHRDNNMYLLCLMVDSYPKKYHFEGFNDFLATLANPIPRILWKNKPILNGAKDLSQQFSFILNGPLFMGTTSLSYSVVGEAYQAKGLLGLMVYSIVYAALLIFFDSLVYYTNRSQALSVGILGVGVFLSFWGYRSFFALVSFIYPIVLFIFLLRLMTKFYSK